jgi:hypothetical protein
MDNRSLQISGYKITASNEVVHKLYGITPEIQEKLEELGIKVYKKKNSAIKELNDLIKKYPSVPQFKNYLSTLYDMQGNYFMAAEINRRIVSLHPEYLFGKLNEANISIGKGEYHQVPEILGDAMEIKAIYPERDEFHVGEVIGFMQTAFNYFIGIEDTEQAQVRLDIIEKLNKAFDLGLNIFEFDRQIMDVNLKQSLKRQKEEWAELRTPKVIEKKLVEPTAEQPVFNHDIINQLYCNSLEIDQQIIAEILNLPRETLIADLHKVIYDSMARVEVFRDMDWDEQTHELVMHALLLLVELNDESSVDRILDIFRQDHNYIEIWFGDFITVGFWELLYPIAHDKLDKLYEFIIEPNGYTYSKSCVSQMVEQIVLHQPGRRTEVGDWYKRVFDFWIANNENDDIIDNELIAFFVADAVGIKLSELKSEITKLYDLNLVAKGVCGSLERCLQDISSPVTINRKHDIFSSIADRYQYYTTTWLNYTGDDDDYHYEEEDENEEDIYEEVKKIVPLQGEKPKVGRNEPCPCGSGKKYKKCCGK